MGSIVYALFRIKRHSFSDGEGRDYLDHRNHRDDETSPRLTLTHGFKRLEGHIHLQARRGRAGSNVRTALFVTIGGDRGRRTFASPSTSSSPSSQTRPSTSSSSAAAMRRRGKLWVWDWRMIPNFEHSYDTAILTMEGRLRSEGYDYDLCLPHTSEKSKYH